MTRSLPQHRYSQPGSHGRADKTRDCATIRSTLQRASQRHPQAGARSNEQRPRRGQREPMANHPTDSIQQQEAGRFQKLIEIGIALSAEPDKSRLMETILLQAKELTNADGGTLYLHTDDELRFEIMRSDTLGIALGGTTGQPITFPPLRMYDAATGEPNHQNVATHAALTNRSVNIPDAYASDEFDFSGTRKFDAETGYRAQSFLTVPLTNHEGRVTGVLQLLNARDSSDQVIAFSESVQPLVEALASQAAVALDNRLLLEAQRALLDSFIELIASAIDAKSPYTGGHCQRVPELCQMLVRAACQATDEPFADFDLSEEDLYELHIASWLHDCGKVTTPEYIVDKATKLETIHDRIHEIRTRFEVVKRDVEIAYLRGRLEGTDDEPTLRERRDERLAELDEQFAFVAECNIGGEFMSEDRIARLREIATTTWMRTLSDRIGLAHGAAKRMAGTPAPELPVEEHLLADKPEHIIPRGPEDQLPEDDSHGFKLDVPEHKYNLGEVYNLSITRGTLTAEERFKINDHIVQTITMLEALPFPRHLARVPEYAGGHHETLVGTGYPRGLRKEDMSIPARSMAIADIFEALTASDRPYKKAKTLSQSVRIMSFMRNDQHIDPDLFELFLRSGIYKTYAERFLEPSQIDEVDIEQYLSGDG